MECGVAVGMEGAVQGAGSKGQSVIQEQERENLSCSVPGTLADKENNEYSNLWLSAPSTL